MGEKRGDGSSPGNGNSRCTGPGDRRKHSMFQKPPGSQSKRERGWQDRGTLVGSRAICSGFSSLSLEQWPVTRAQVSNVSLWLLWVQQIPGELDDRYRSTGKQGPQLDRAGQIDSKRHGLAKKFIQFFCIRCYGKVPTNFLANPILQR